MSPPIFLLGVFSILTIWVITSLGLPPNLWTFGVVPLLSIYFLCDQRKLWEAALQVRGSSAAILGAAVVPLCSILYFHFMLWKLCLLLSCLFCLYKAFDPEKKMYMGDTYGELAKSMVWKVATIFTGAAERMTYKGEWAYCSPYSRRLVRKSIGRYYTLQPKAGAQNEIFPENFDLNFPIESCRVVCQYTREGDDGTDATGDYTSPSSVGIRGYKEIPPPSIPRPQLEKVKVGTVLHSYSESLSLKAKGDVIMGDKYALRASQVNKLEVSLQYEDESLESYTFYDMSHEGVAEVKRVLDILSEQGNLIFSSVSTNVGSSVPQAHAKCYEFEELFELLLNKGYKITEVNLPATCICNISGTGMWFMHLQVLEIGLVVWMNFYQLTHGPQLSVVVSLIAILAIVQMLLLVGNYIAKEQHIVKRCMHWIISRMAPSRVEIVYRLFQEYVPSLTFCNESYGYPYTSSQRQVCWLKGGLQSSNMRFPIIGIERPEDLHLEEMRPGFRSFNLRTMQLELLVYSGDDGEFSVNISMRRNHDKKCCYQKLFTTQERPAANLIALMAWQEEHRCVGVCKEWPERTLMYAYRFDELFISVLTDGARPVISRLPSPIDISVE